jgi:hypothetical protein
VIPLSFFFPFFLSLPLLFSSIEEPCFSSLFSISSKASFSLFFPWGFFSDPFHLSCKKKVFILSSSTPYEEGKELGHYFKEEIQSLCRAPLTWIQQELSSQGIDPKKKAQELERVIPEKFLQEMRGIADGARVSYQKILEFNTLPTLLFSWGCSMIGAVEGKDPLIATNHYPSQTSENANGFCRLKLLREFPLRANISSLKAALEKVSLLETLQSMIFDVETKSIHLAIGSRFAASKSYRFFSKEDLFKNSPLHSLKKKIFLARTLDWPLSLLGHKTLLLIRKTNNHSYALITWPGYLGALSGINDKGLCLSVSSVLGKQKTTLPNPLFLRDLLEKATSIEEAWAFLKKQKASCGMNLLIAAKDGVALFELHPEKRIQADVVIKTK